jgi:mono/diheme cytochrome c family protein
MPSQEKNPKNYWVPAFIAGLALAGVVLWLLVRGSNYGPWVAPAAAKSLANPAAANPTGLAAAKQIYADRCARCHGDQGNGDGPDASMYKTPPGVLSDARLMGQEADGEIFWKIGEGRRPMPGFEKELSDEQRWQLVNFIRSLARPAPQTLPSAPAPQSKN